jgi:hypothetical protein
MATKVFTVSIPCKPYLVKFAQTLCKAEQIPLTRQTSLGIFATYALTKEMYNNRQPNTKSPTYKGMTGKLTFTLNKWQFERIGFNIPFEDAIAINSFIDHQFQEALLLYTNAHVKQTTSPKKGFDKIYIDFCKIYGIELGVDIEYDTIAKKGYRSRNALPAANPMTTLFTQTEEKFCATLSDTKTG